MLDKKTHKAIEDIRQELHNEGIYKYDWLLDEVISRLKNPNRKQPKEGKEMRLYREIQEAAIEGAKEYFTLDETLERSISGIKAKQRKDLYSLLMYIQISGFWRNFVKHLTPETEKRVKEELKKHGYTRKQISLFFDFI